MKSKIKKLYTHLRQKLSVETMKKYSKKPAFSRPLYYTHFNIEMRYKANVD